jgi:RHS repeat-associated protein
MDSDLAILVMCLTSITLSQCSPLRSASNLRLATVTNPGSLKTSYAYDGLGKVIQKRQQLGTTLDTTSYGYTLADRLQTAVDPDSTTTTYSRDADGRVTSLAVSPPSGAAVTAVSAITYRPFGPISGYTLGNGQVITRSYDANDALTDLTSPALTLHFARDAMGNITAEGNAAGANPATETYTYDPLYRLTTIADGSTAIEGLTYNPTGDRLSKTGSGQGVGSYAYTSGTHQLSGIGTAARANDANGNTTASANAGQTWGYGYNGRNRLTVVQASGVTVGTYTYNAMGQRIQKIATSPTAITQRYAYDEQGHLIGEYTSTSNRDTIWMGDLPVATVDTAGATSTINYVTADHLGTPRAVSNSAGATIWSWPYVGNAFGETAPTSSNGYVLNFRFPGQYYDAESGLVHNGHRDYCLECGRYIQSDPSGLPGGISTFAYGSNNPLNYVDPTGLWVCNGSPAQCSSFSNGLQSVQSASTSSNLESYQQASLANIVNAYGIEGDPNVQIGFASLPSGIKGKTGENKNGCGLITFDSSQIIDALNPTNQWGAAIAHEGQHLADDDEANATGYRVSIMDTEVNAYTSESYYDQAKRYPEMSAKGNIWTYGGGINYSAIQSRAAWSTSADMGR